MGGQAELKPLAQQASLHAYAHSSSLPHHAPASPQSAQHASPRACAFDCQPAHVPVRALYLDHSGLECLFIQAQSLRCTEQIKCRSDCRSMLTFDYIYEPISDPTAKSEEQHIQQGLVAQDVS